MIRWLSLRWAKEKKSEEIHRKNIAVNSCKSGLPVDNFTINHKMKKIALSIPPLGDLIPQWKQFGHMFIHSGHELK